MWSVDAVSGCGRGDAVSGCGRGNGVSGRGRGDGVSGCGGEGGVYLTVGLAHFGLCVVPLLIQTVDDGRQLLAGFLSTQSGVNYGALTVGALTVGALTVGVGALTVQRTQLRFSRLKETLHRLR